MTSTPRESRGVVRRLRRILINNAGTSDAQQTLGERRNPADGDGLHEEAAVGQTTHTSNRKQTSPWRASSPQVDWHSHCATRKANQIASLAPVLDDPPAVHLAITRDNDEGRGTVTSEPVEEACAWSGRGEGPGGLVKFVSIAARC